ncbi:MAG: 50S ribosomal protein L22 [bacterium]
MEVKAVAKYIRVSPLKVKKVTDLIQGKPAVEAVQILNFTRKGGVGEVAKVLKSALANAKNNFELSSDTLYVKKALVGKGATLKRTKPRARGRADLMRRRSSHITIVLEEFGRGTEG